MDGYSVTLNSDKNEVTIKIGCHDFTKNLTTRSLSLILYQELCSGLPRYYTYGVTIFTSEYAYLFGRISKSLAQQAAY